MHIGQLIHEKMIEERRLAAWLAEQLHCHRSNIYKIYKNPSVDAALLRRISRILKHDFFKRCSDEFVTENT
jgi:plasmid maintenance system antidote protein VapI